MEHLIAELDRRLEAGDRLLIATDFDGTLCPIVCSPERARLSPMAADVVRQLSSLPRAVVAVISGRSLTDLAARVPGDLIFAGNHGLEISGRGILFEHPVARRLWPDLQELCSTLRTRIAEWPGAWVEDKRLTATVHYRHVDHAGRGSLRIAVRRTVGVAPFAVRAGKEALELRPKVAWDKGAALDMIATRLGPFASVLCMGDDRTDECMFRRNGSQLNVFVGERRPSAATFRLQDDAEVAFLLVRLVEMLSARAIPAVRSAAQPPDS